MLPSYAQGKSRFQCRHANPVTRSVQKPSGCMVRIYHSILPYHYLPLPLWYQDSIVDKNNIVPVFWILQRKPASIFCTFPRDTSRRQQNSSFRDNIAQSGSIVCLSLEDAKGSIWRTANGRSHRTTETTDSPEDMIIGPGHCRHVKMQEIVKVIRVEVVYRRATFCYSRASASARWPCTAPKIVHFGRSGLAQVLANC